MIAHAENRTVRSWNLGGISRHKYGPFLLVWLIGILARVPFYLAFKPIWSGDSPQYVMPYYLWRNHMFYEGERTPVYPMFLGLAQWLCRVPASPTLPMSAAYLAVCTQSVLDIVAACLLYFTLGKLNVRRSIALVAAVFAVTAPSLCSIEINILNLSLSFAVLALCMSLVAVLMRKIYDGSRYFRASLLCGVVFGCAALLRPENLVFFVIIATSLLGRWAILALRGVRTPLENRVPIAVLLTVLSAAPPILAWMTWNYVGIGEFRITTLTGWNRSKTVYNMFDRVDPEDRLLGQLLTKSYLQRNRDGRIVRDHIWQAAIDIWNVSMYMPLENPTETLSAFHLKVDRAFEDLSGMRSNVPCAVPGEPCTALLRRKINIGDYVGRVSWKLIEKYPGAYLANVADNFVRDTFNVSNAASGPSVEDYRSTSVDGSEFIRNESLANLSGKAINLQAPLLTLLYVITLGFVVSSPLVFISQPESRPIADTVVTVFALATVGTFIAMCFLSGYNKEYSIPHLGVMVICTAYAVENRLRIATVLGFGARRERLPAQAALAGGKSRL